MAYHTSNTYHTRGCGGRVHMVAGFTITYAINSLSPLMLRVRISCILAAIFIAGRTDCIDSWIYNYLCKQCLSPLCDKVC